MSGDLRGWHERFNEGLVAPNTWGGVPTLFFCLAIVPGFGVAVLLQAWLLLPILCGVYAVAAALTLWDPHWPGVLWDFIRAPQQIDP